MEELSILDGTLTDDQKMAFRAAVTQEKVEEDIFDMQADELRVKARKLKGEGKTFPEISTEMSIGINKVAELLKDEAF